MRQAASMFQLAHPDVRVELIDGQTEAGSTTVSDTIRALNTELLSGNGADVLVLDGLPADAYIEKGEMCIRDRSGPGQVRDRVAGRFYRGQKSAGRGSLLYRAILLSPGCHFSVISCDYPIKTADRRRNLAWGYCGARL